MLEELFAQRLDSEAFESVVDEYWKSGRFVRRGPEGTAARLRRWAKDSPGSSYGRDDARVPFTCHCLFGEPGRPGAFHVAGPGEAEPSSRLADKNRAPHAHETARIAIITGGRATFFVHRVVDGRDVVIEAPVAEGDVIFWPRWATHTFDAGEAGFSLFSGMGAFLSPDTEHFIAEPPEGQPDLDELPRVAYEHLNVAAR